MPLVWKLTEELKNWLTSEKLRKFNQEWCAQGDGYPDEVIESFVGALERSDLHYEALLGYLETQYRRHQPHREHYHGLYSWLVQVIYYLLYSRHVKNLEFFHRMLPSYAGIRALAEQNNPLWVFSLNYDLIIEALAATFRIPIHSGFSERTISLPRRNKSGEKVGALRAQVLSEEELKEALYFPNPPESGIYLLKIHGALDVFAYEDGRNLLKLIPDENTVESLLDALSAINEEVFYPFPGSPNGRVNTSNEITYADGSGEMQFLRRTLLAGAYKFDSRHSQVLPHALLEQFKTNINFVTKLVCIGYGFGDLHINAVIRQWLEFVSTRRLVIVNPGVTEAPSFLLHLAPQVEVFPDGATEYFDSVGGITRTRKEKLERRLGAYFRKHGAEQAALKINLFYKNELSERVGELARQLTSSPEPSLEECPEPEMNEQNSNLDEETNGALERLVKYLEKTHSDKK